MGRSLLFRNLNQVMRLSSYCKKNQISNSHIEQLTQLSAQMSSKQTNKRDRHSAVESDRAQLTPSRGRDVKIAIVGAGCAGLACGLELKQHGILATIYEASNRVGGRCFSLGGSFPGEVNFPNTVVERGGELIDSQNKALLRLVKKFNLELEDVSQQPGEVACYFNGQRYAESAIIDEYRNFLAAIDADLRLLSSKPNADNHNAADAYFDKIDLLEYLETRGAGDLIKAIIRSAYMAD